MLWLVLLDVYGLMFDMWLLLLLHLAGTLENASERSCTAPYQVHSLPVDTPEAC
jgi:hypothetical protein